LAFLAVMAMGTNTGGSIRILAPPIAGQTSAALHRAKPIEPERRKARRERKEKKRRGETNSFFASFALFGLCGFLRFRS